MDFKSYAEVSAILELGNVWVFEQLIFGPHWPMNQLNKNPNIAYLQDSWYHWSYVLAASLELRHEWQVTTCTNSEGYVKGPRIWSDITKFLG